MTFEDYQKACQQRARPGSTKEDLTCFSMGMAGESGESLDHIKKHLFHGHTLDRDHLIKELGDVLWYLTMLTVTIGTSLEHVALTNQAKLAARYPHGFNEADSLARKEQPHG